MATSSATTSDTAPTAASTPPQQRIRPLVHFLAGGVGGTIGAVLTCPLERVKTIQQSSAHQANQGRGIASMMRSIYVNEGVAGLWRGIGPNLIGVIPARAIYFSTYASSKHYLTHDVRLNNGEESSLIHLLAASVAVVATATATNPIWCIKTRMQLQTKPQSIASSSSTVGSPLPSITRSPQQQMRHTGKRLKTAAHGRHATSAVTATTSLFTPRIPIIDNRSSAQSPAIHQTLHRSKVSAAVSYSTAATAVAVSSRTTALPSTAATVPSIRQPPTEMYYKNSLDCARQILRQEGARGLFRGLGASYLGVIETGCQWVVYERMKKSVREYHDAKNAASSTTTTSASTKPGILLDYLLVSAVAKTVATLLSYPHEVLRTRLRQTVTTTSASDSAVTVVRPRYAGMRDVVRTVWRQEGARAFYGGLTAHLFRTVPNAAIMFFCYESVVFLADVVQ